MKRRLLATGLLTTVVLLGVLTLGGAAEPRSRSRTRIGPPAPAETPETPQTQQERDDSGVHNSLWNFWQDFVLADALNLEADVDFPLTLQEQDAERRDGQRFVITRDGWEAFRRGLPSAPLPADDVELELSAVRLEWLDPITCLAVYDVRISTRDGDKGGHYMSLLVDREGWKVAVSSIPM